MRSLIISHAAIRASNRRIYRELAARGGDVVVVVPDRWKSALGELTAEVEPADSKLRVVVRKRIGTSHSNLYYLAGLNRVAAAYRPDAIYVDEDPAGLAAAQGALNAARYGAGLVVLGIQNLFKVYPLPFERLQRFVFNRTTTAVYTSVQAAEILKRRGFDGRLIPMPFSTDLTVPSHERKAAIRAAWDLRGPLAGFSGRLVPEKGIDVFLKALAQLPAVNGAIIGTGPEQDALQGLARDLGIHERVRFLQPEGPARAMELLSALDVLALPSRTMPNWAEQFGRVLIEAMATGVAVVASDSGAIGEVVGDAGLLVPENDSDALAAGLQRALKDPARLIERGLERVRARYTSAVEADALQTALEAAALSVKLAGVSSKDEVA